MINNNNNEQLDRNPGEISEDNNTGSNQNSVQVFAIVEGVNEAEMPTGNGENRPEAASAGSTTCNTCGSRTTNPSVASNLRNCNVLNDPNEGNNVSIYISRSSQPPVGESSSVGHQASVPPIEISINVSYAPPITVGTSGLPGGSAGTTNARPIPPLAPLSSSNRSPQNVYVQIQNGPTAATSPSPPPSDFYLPTNYETLVRCAICFRPANVNHPRVTTCGHVFCGPCLEQALRIRFNCPICGTTQEFRHTLPIYL
ncbi:uncharacterized protein dgrn [Drosophila bipectinata]|uniref:uncharacterized protein dgrn n=1 Tax=Drosophila bipectinata TaxID=42026 RepID=UPI0038B3D073